MVPNMNREHSTETLAQHATSQAQPIAFENNIDHDRTTPLSYINNFTSDNGYSLNNQNDIKHESQKFVDNQSGINKAGGLYSGEKIFFSGRSNTGFSSFGGFHDKVKLSTTRSGFTHFLCDWWLELIACFFLIGGMLAIIVIAIEYQDHPLPNLPSGLSINSIISIFSVVLKTAMLLILAQGLSHMKWTWFRMSRPLNDLATYDNASRGPLGSIWLLFTLRGRDVISSIGAILVIAAVIVDPMAQQVIRYYNCNRIQPSFTASLPRTNAYMEIGKHAAASVNTISASLQSAINGGVFVPGAQVDFDCNSGNCTFPTTHSIGMRSTCSDVSNELVFSNVSMDTYTALNATLPSGLHTSYDSFTTTATFMTMGWNSTYGAVELILGPRFNDPQTQRNLCATSSDPDASLGINPDWNCRGWGAARCHLDPVVYSITNASIRSGKLRETLEYATTLNLSSAGFSANSFSVADLSCLTDAQITALNRDAGYEISSSAEWLPYNVSLSFQGELQAANASLPNATRDIVPKECIYQVNSVTMNSLFTFFGDYFSGSIVRYGSEYTGPSVVQQFYNSSGITFDSVNKMFENIANGLTTHIRQAGFKDNSAPALGQVWETNACVRVRWPYLAFPASLTVLTLLFFIAMVVVTGRSQQGVHHDFKSSPLALLFHGLDEDTTRRVESARAGESNEVGDLKNDAKEINVRLRPTDKGWRFVADDSSLIVDR